MAHEREPLTKALIAVLSPGVATLVFYAGVWTRFTNNRVFDGLITLLLAAGGYYGIMAFRSRNTRTMVRVLGLLAAIVCVPYGLVMLFITLFGLA